MKRMLLLVGWTALLCSTDGPTASAADAERVIAVVVAPGRTQKLTMAEVALIFRRKKLFWDDGTRVNPVNLPAVDLDRRAFSESVLGASPEELERYWNDMYFHGVSPPYVLASEEAVLRFVAQTPGAIGYVPFCSVAARADIALIVSRTGPLSEDRARASCRP